MFKRSMKMVRLTTHLNTQKQSYYYTYKYMCSYMDVHVFVCEHLYVYRNTLFI